MSNTTSDNTNPETSKPEATAGDKPAFSTPFVVSATGGFNVGTAAPTDEDDKVITTVQKRLDQLGLNAMKQHQEGEGDDDEEAIVIPQSIVHRLMALKQIQNEKDEIDKEYLAERLALETKYAEKLKPMYQRRFEVVSGKVDVQIKFEEEEGQTKEIQAEEDGIQGIPGFWLRVLKNNRLMDMLITDEDEDALRNLIDIRLEFLENMGGFTLIFQFSENAYFENEILTKTYLIPDMLEGPTPSLQNIQGTEIQWKPKKNLTVEEVQKKQRAKHGRNKGATRVVTKQVQKASFFNFFTAPPMDDDDDDEEEEHMEEDFSPTLSWEEDYEVGFTIRSTLIPNAVSWYIGGMEEDDDDDEDFEGDDGDEDEDEEDDDENDDDDDDEPDDEAAPVKGRKGGKKGKGGKGGNAPSPFAPAEGAAAQPECKQS